MYWGRGIDTIKHALGLMFRCPTLPFSVSKRSRSTPIETSVETSCHGTVAVSKYSLVFFSGPSSRRAYPVSGIFFLIKRQASATSPGRITKATQYLPRVSSRLFLFFAFHIHGVLSAGTAPQSIEKQSPGSPQKFQPAPLSRLDFGSYSCSTLRAHDPS